MVQLLLLATIVTLANAGLTSLWPLPNVIQSTNSASCFLMTPDTFTLRPQGDAIHSPVIQSAIVRFQQGNFLFPRGVPRVPGVAYSDCSLADVPGRKQRLLKSLKIYVEDISGDLKLNISEWYNLSITYGTGAVLSAKTVFGAVRGLETFAQLIDFAHFDAKQDQTVFALESLPIFIEDDPAYPFRGFLIDTSRHFLPVDLIVQQLDAMAMNKFNVLHWHITDSNAFPFYSKVYPQLPRKAAYHPGLTYSYDDVRRIVREAYLRGIIVMPEFDAPGHSESWGKAFPEMISNCQGTAKPMNPSRPLTYSVLSEIYQEAANLFPSDLFHIGGDEVETACWKETDGVAEFMKQQGYATPMQVAQHFYDFMHEAVGVRLNKRVFVWQEVYENSLSLPKNVVLDVWKHWGNWRNVIKFATKQEIYVVVSSGWYLDWLDAGVEQFYRSHHKTYGGNELTQKFILGGKACMWSEKTDASTFMSTSWPRASCVVEKLWTKRDYSITDVISRLAEFRCRMIARGIGAGTLDKEGGFCLIEYQQ
jgi:hexosaminidase